MKARIIILLICVIAFSSCDTTVQTGNSDARIMPNVTGSAGEVLVVMDKFLWDGSAGEALKDVLKKEFPGLPQSEPSFDVAQISAGSFSNVNKFHRSVVLLTINETASEPSLRFRTNVWAKPQIVVQIEASNKSDLEKVIKENDEQIRNFLIQYDRKRIMENYIETKDIEIQKQIAEHHQISLGIPRGYNIDLSNDEYTSVSIEASDFSQVLQIFEYPAEPGDMTSEKLLEKRNEFVEKYVKGPRDGSYMTTSQVFPPMFYDLAYDSMEVVEIRGLWDLEGGYMGGPFVSHSVYDGKRKRIVTVEGYVYYPNKKKRVKIRQLEAIIYSLKML